jgi:hypothetical protein
MTDLQIVKMYSGVVNDGGNWDAVIRTWRERPENEVADGEELKRATVYAKILAQLNRAKKTMIAAGIGDDIIAKMIPPIKRGRVAVVQDHSDLLAFAAQLAEADA